MPFLQTKFRPIVAILFSVLVGSFTTVLLFVTDLMQARGYVVETRGVLIGRDFVNVWISGKLVWDGALNQLYDLHAYMGQMHHWFPHQDAHNYSYPPSTLFFAAPLAKLPYPLAYGVWTLATGGLFILAARPFLGRLPLGLCVVTAGAAANIAGGQYGFLAGALWLMTFNALDRPAGRAGLFAGLLTIKPHLGLLLPPIMLVRRRYQAMLTAMLVIFVMVALTAAVFGHSIWAHYWTDVPKAQYEIMTASGNRFYFTMMPTTLVAMRSWPHWIAVGAQVFTAAAAFVLLWQARHLPNKRLAFIAATATFLILPYAFSYDMTVLCLGVSVLMADRWLHLSRTERYVLMATAALPSLLLVQVATGLLISPIVLLWCLWIQVDQGRKEQAEDRSCELGS